MNTKKCDRCGKYYDNNELNKNFEEFYDFLGVDRCNGCFEPIITIVAYVR